MLLLHMLRARNASGNRVRFMKGAAMKSLKWGDGLTIALLGTVLILGGSAGAGEKKNPATTPTPRVKKDKDKKQDVPDTGWMKRHEGFVDIAKKGGVNVLVLGDSITDAWRGPAAKPTWEKLFEPLKSANFGIGGDRTEHVLWRIQNGELDGIKPKVIMLMIGTNNSGSNSAEQIADGITAIVKTIQQKTPTTKVLLLGVFPRGEKAGTPVREKIAQINKKISKLDDGGKSVKYLDIGDRFLQKDGTLTKDIMPDFLHLSARGYEIWGDAVAPTVKELLN
jgi:lysophospholipase L1-like esterase